MKPKYRIHILGIVFLHCLLLFGVFNTNAQSSRYIRDLSFNKNKVTTASMSRCVEVVRVGPLAGKIMVAGGFPTFSGLYWPSPAPYPKVVRLNSDGTIDNTFKAVLDQLGSGVEIYTMAVQPDGKVIVGGTFTIKVGEVYYHNLCRLNLDGSFDPTFLPENGGVWGDDTGNDSVRGLLITNGSDGKPKVWVVGLFESCNGERVVSGAVGERKGGAVILNMGDGSIYAKPYVEDSKGTSGGGVYAIAPRANGNVLLAGEFGAIGGAGSSSHLYVRRVVSLLPNGQLDPAYKQVADIYGGPGGPVFAVAEQVQSDNSYKIIIAGAFTTYRDNRTGAGAVINYSNLNHISRLNEDGSLDNTFQANVTTGFNNGWIYKILPDKKGRLIMGGEFTSYNNNLVNRIVRLQPDGSYDASFDTGSGFDGLGGVASPQILGLAFQSFAGNPEGAILIAGNFASYDTDSAQRYTIRLFDVVTLATTLSHLTVKKENAQAVLNWQGRADYKYTVERSFDGKSFTALNTISDQTNYVYRDALTTAGRVYYRLSVCSSNPADPSVMYSQVISVVNTSYYTVTFSRLSAQQVKVSIAVPASQNEKLRISLISTSGQLLYEEQLLMRGQQLEKMVTLPANAHHSLLVVQGQTQKEPLKVMLLQ